MRFIHTILCGIARRMGSAAVIIIHAEEIDTLSPYRFRGGQS